jgi:hypothetical protein
MLSTVSWFSAGLAAVELARHGLCGAIAGPVDGRAQAVAALIDHHIALANQGDPQPTELVGLATSQTVEIRELHAHLTEPGREPAQRHAGSSRRVRVGVGLELETVPPNRELHRRPPGDGLQGAAPSLVRP